MIDSLYEPFKKWSEKGSVWLISDPHFNDEDCKLMNPNWIEPDDYIKVLNGLVFKNDTLVCLGDCGNIERFKELKAGRKILIKGNHDDRGDSYYKRKETTFWYEKSDYETLKDINNHLKTQFPNEKITILDGKEWDGWRHFDKWIVTIDNNLFDEVYSGCLFIAPQILLSHEPIYGLKFCTNIHGHEHNGIYYYADREGGRHLNIAADVIGYQPVSLGKLIQAGLVYGLPTIHRIVIDKATENKA